MPVTHFSSLIRLSKPIGFMLCLTPAVILLINSFRQEIGANPVEMLLHDTGIWTLRLLLITLANKPFERVFGIPWILEYRRMLGLFVFFYAVLHFLVYLVLDRELAWNDILIDFNERLFITVGLVAFILLIPLVITSTRGWKQRLKKRWNRLHKSIYLITALGLLHFLILVKADVGEPLIYIAIFILLIALRIRWVEQLIGIHLLRRSNYSTKRKRRSRT